MKIHKVRVENYKSFRDSDWMTFGSTMNVIVGQNNSGKSALLATLTLSGCTSRPHIGPSVRIPNPISRYFVEVGCAGNELREAILLEGVEVLWPCYPEEAFESVTAPLYAETEIIFEIEARYGHCSAVSYPSHGLFTPTDQGQCVALSPLETKQTFKSLTRHNSNRDDGATVMLRYMPKRIYLFNAERPEIGTCSINSQDTLLPNARNLPKVLQKLFLEEESRNTYNGHVNELFPNISHVAIDSDSSNLILMAGSVARDGNKKLLLFNIHESGTGVGQVLAILLVAMTYENCVIIIDEPNSFLHPGAAKKLVEIIRKYNKNQYFISTHSPDIINSADPDTIHQVRWQNGESVVQEFIRSDIDDMRSLLRDVGADLSDVFGLYSIVWVEGPTETSCFRDLASSMGYTTTEVAFCTLWNTGDLEQKGPDARVFAEIYRRLSEGATLLPPAVAFHLDGEGRSEAEKKELRRRTDVNLCFLPRRMYESYLINVDAILAVLNSDLSASSAGFQVREAHIIEWLQKRAAEFSGAKQWTGDYKFGQWLATCDGAKLLTSLFSDLGQAKANYHKTKHSPLLTRWLIEHDPDSLLELKNYVARLCGEKI